MLIYSIQLTDAYEKSPATQSNGISLLRSVEVHGPVNQSSKMNLLIVLSLFLLILSESKTEDRQLYKCMSTNEDSREIKFICGTNSSITNEMPRINWNCTVDNGSQQNYSCNGEFTPKNFTLFWIDLRGVEILMIESLEIQHINPNEDEFHSESITDLYASRNQLSNIPSSISMPKLSYIDFSHNKFTSITTAVLMNAARVKRLFFAHNKISSIEVDVFSKFTELKTLDLSHNHIKSSDLECFKVNANLESLYLSHNSLDSLPENVTPEKCSHLTKLAFDGNKFDCEYLEEFLKPWNGSDLMLEKGGEDVPANTSVDNFDCYHGKMTRLEFSTALPTPQDKTGDRCTQKHHTTAEASGRNQTRDKDDDESS